MSQQTVESGQTTGKFLTLALSKENYGIEITKVQEIIGVTSITPVPRSPSYIKGVTNLRGKIIPLVDLRIKFGLEPAPYDEKTCIVVVNIPKGDQKISVGIIVDTVLEVVNFLPNEVDPTPNYGTHLDTDFIIGMGKKDGRISILIDIQRVLTDESQKPVAELAAAVSAANT